MQRERARRPLGRIVEREGNLCQRGSQLQGGFPDLGAMCTSAGLDCQVIQGRMVEWLRTVGRGRVTHLTPNRTKKRLIIAGRWNHLCFNV